MSFCLSNISCLSLINKKDNININIITERARLALRLKPVIAERAEKNLHLSGGAGVKGRQKSDNLSDTKHELAKAAGVSHDTIAKVEKIEAKATPAIKEQLERAEMRLGELTAAMPKASGARTDLTSSSMVTRLETKKEALNRVSIPKQKAAQYEQMAAHPEIVEKFGTRGAGDQRSCFGR